MTVTLADVEAAAAAPARARSCARPCLLSRTLSEITGAELWLKFENLQYTASFKERGAYNRLVAAQPEQARRAAWSPCRPATTRRAWPTTPAAWASRPRS